MLGMDVGPSSLSLGNKSSSGVSDDGGLVGARVGYGLNRVVTPYVGMYEADFDSPAFDAFDKATIGRVDLGTRLHLASDRRWTPYGDVALTLQIVSDVFRDGQQRRTEGFTGTAFSAGGGVAFYLSKKWALDVNVKWGMGRFSNVRLDDLAIPGLSVGARSTRYTLGVSWWP